MRVSIVTTHVPFVRGGAEILAEGLREALHLAGHEVEISAIPFKWYPPERVMEHMMACRLLDLTEACGEKIDRVIGLKFPAYLIPHPRKVLWLLHQHRSAYDLWGTEYCDLIQAPNGLQARETIRNADNRVFEECHAIFTIAKNVSNRLKRFNQVDSTPLYHPPQNEDLFYCEESADYFFFPSRIWTVKRQSLVIQALAKTTQPVRVVFAGKAEQDRYFVELKNLAETLNVSQRVHFLGSIGEEEKLKHYARAIAVVYPPLDEDYGYVTLEAMLSSKPVITCSDSGGPLEFVCDQKTGLVAEPTPSSLALAMDQLWENRALAKELGSMGRKHYKSLGISWNNVVQTLLA